MKLKNVRIPAMAVVLLSASFAALAQESTATVSLGDLYERYADADYSSMAMPEFGQEITVSGIALDVPQSLAGNALLSAGEEGWSDELARLTAVDDSESRKLEALQPGEAFTAVCTLGMTSNSPEMSLQDCAFK